MPSLLFQSGFKAGLGTETALITLVDDIWERDGGNVTLLCLLSCF